jgi:hypothetical protein
MLDFYSSSASEMLHRIHMLMEYSYDHDAAYAITVSNKIT